MEPDKTAAEGQAVPDHDVSDVSDVSDANDLLDQPPGAALGLSARAARGLRRGGVATVRDLCARAPEDLLRIRQFGAGTLLEVTDRLAERGLRLAPPAAPTWGPPPPSQPARMGAALGRLEALVTRLESAPAAARQAPAEQRNCCRQRVVEHALQVARLQTMGCTVDGDGVTNYYCEPDLEMQISGQLVLLEREARLLLSQLTAGGGAEEGAP